MLLCFAVYKLYRGVIRIASIRMAGLGESTGYIVYKFSI